MEMRGLKDPIEGQEEKTEVMIGEVTEVTGEITAITAITVITATTEINVVVSAGEEETGIEETAKTEE